MKSGLIIYNEADYQRNVWFVSKCIEEFTKNDISLSYVEEKEVLKYLNNHPINFVIYRGRDWNLLKRIQELGIICFNKPYTNHVANDKYLTCSLLRKNDISCIESFLSIDDIKQYPCIMKSVDGHGGKEVFLISSKEEAKDISLKYNKQFIYQDFYKNNGDVRLYLLNKKVIGAVKRSGGKDFRNNYSLGGEVSSYNPSKEMEDVAESIAKLIDADFIGVDFLISDDGFSVSEIEDPVGSRMLYKTSDIDIINLFVSFICKKLLNN